MENQKSYCLNCRKEVSNDTGKCDCGGHSFAFGDLKVEGEKIVCKCGNDTFNRTAHMDFTHKATTSMVCTKCGNLCGTEHYRDEEELMYWS